MATTRSTITRLVRAAVSHCTPTTTTLLRPYHNLSRNHHTFTHTSPLSFLHSHPFNHRISKPNFFSTSRRVNPRATAPKLGPLLKEGMIEVVVNILVIGGCVYMIHRYMSKFPASLDEEAGTKFKGSLPDFVHKGHTVVVEGHIKPVKGYFYAGYDFELYCSATEVLSKPDHIVAAMDRNSYIIRFAEEEEEKQNVATEVEDDPNVAKQNLINVAQEEKHNFVEEEEKQNVLGEERDVAINRCTSTNLNDVVTKDVAILTITLSAKDVGSMKITLSFHDALVLEGRVNQSTAFSLIAKLHICGLLREALREFEGLPDALREGHSVLVERSVKAIRHRSKEEDKSGKIVAVKVNSSEYHISAEVLANDKKCKPQDSAAIEE